MNIPVNTIMCIVVDLITIILLLLILFNFGLGYKKSEQVDDKIFKTIVSLTILILFNDSLAYFCDGREGLLFNILNYIANISYAFFVQASSMYWILYCYKKLNVDKRKVKMTFPIILTFSIFMFLLTLLSLYTKTIFWIDSNNYYVRGKYNFYFSLINLLYFVYSSYLILYRLNKSKSREEARQAKVLLSYVIFPVIGTFLQLISYGINTIWIFSAISLLILYFHLQNAQLSSDYLTGLNNRRRFEMYIEKKLANRNKDKIIFLFIIDINNFKSINDNCGHYVGDKALVEFAKLLSDSVYKEDFIARVGGDEFVVFGERNSLNYIDDLKNSILRNVSDFNRSNKSSERDYILSISIGVSKLLYDENKSMDEFLIEADKEMYNEKNKLNSIYKEM